MKDIVSCDVLGNVNANEINFKENIEGINEWPHSWPYGEISYRLNDHTTDHRIDWQIRAVVVAFRTWQWRIPRANLKFRRERNPDVNVDINVEFEEEDHFSSRNVLAHAYFPGQGDISGDCHINDGSWNWQPGVHLSDLARPPLVPVLIHEFGHSLGLRHDTSDNQSIMYPSINLGRPTNKLGPRDITRIQERYGVRNLPNWFIRRFQKRRDMGWDFY